MNTIAPHAVGLLDHLIHLCWEASCENGLATAHVREPELRAVLESGANEHALHARELTELIPPADRGAVEEHLMSGARNPEWAELTRAILRGDQQAILEACLHGERLLLTIYAEAANDAALSPEAAEVLREQHETVAARHSLLRACCERAVPQEV